MKSDTPNTYFERAVADADEAGGRFAKATTVFVTGTGTAPPLPNPEWSTATAVIPNEEPLGYSVDELPDMTTANGAPLDD